jgi:hypothetical protein
MPRETSLNQPEPKQTEDRVRQELPRAVRKTLDAMVSQLVKENIEKNLPSIVEQCRNVLYEKHSGTPSGSSASSASEDIAEAANQAQHILPDATAGKDYALNPRVVNETPQAFATSDAPFDLGQDAVPSTNDNTLLTSFLDSSYCLVPDNSQKQFTDHDTWLSLDSTYNLFDVNQQAYVDPCRTTELDEPGPSHASKAPEENTGEIRDRSSDEFQDINLGEYLLFD